VVLNHGDVNYSPIHHHDAIVNYSPIHHHDAKSLGGKTITHFFMFCGK